MIDTYVKELLCYGVEAGLLPASELDYAANLIIDLFHQDTYSNPSLSEDAPKRPLHKILQDLCNEAAALGIIDGSITERDLLDTKIMNCILPRPETVKKQFEAAYKISPEAATEYYYAFSQASNYIRRDRIAKDKKWTVDSSYGDMEITINLSKPEKDPKAIAAARTAKSTSYPSCMLCTENVGYAGRLDYPARQNHRIIPMTLANQQWYLQYSPYVYYNEHCIVLRGEHVPMEISETTFEKLFDFIKLFPHYFVGSNADLPIVGGSILSHEHFQGGHHTFAMAKAKDLYSFTVDGFHGISCSIIHWPMSVIRLRSADVQQLCTLANHILKAWRTYTDEAAGIYCKTGDENHNTITPIARFANGQYELDLTLRNNITTPEHPLGVFHPHEKLHHIKKENIGLIEVMGLAVLPSRLDNEMDLLAEYILEKKEIRSCDSIAKHAPWVDAFLPHYTEITSENIHEILQQEIGKVFVEVLEDAGVYKATPEGLAAFQRFVHTL